MKKMRLKPVSYSPRATISVGVVIERKRTGTTHARNGENNCRLPRHRTTPNKHCLTAYWRHHLHPSLDANC